MIQKLLTGAAVALAIAAPAGAATLQFGDSYYTFVTVRSGITWADANAAAALKTYEDLDGVEYTGRLVTITSEEENDFLINHFATDEQRFFGGWLGGKVMGNVGSWVTGPEAGDLFTYTNWGGIEPNDGAGTSYAYMNIGVPSFGIDSGEWADAINGRFDSSADPVYGYFVEYDAAQGVPEPATWAVMLTGFLGAGAVLRRRRAALA